MRFRAVTLLELMVIIAIVSIVGFALFGHMSCSDRSGAEGALHGLGFKDVEVRDPEFWSACGKGDSVNHPFTAKNVNGESVRGTVCCGGPLSRKGCTVRF